MSERYSEPDTVDDDTQYPNQHTLRPFEDNPDDIQEAQLTFISARIASALALRLPAAWIMAGTASKTLLRRYFSTGGENNRGAFSQIVNERVEDRGDPPDRCDRHRPAGSESWLATRIPSTADSMRKSPNRKKSTAAGTPMFPAAISPTAGSRTMRDFFPPASATRSAGLTPRAVGWISARAPGKPYSTTTHPRTPRRRRKSAPGPAV